MTPTHKPRLASPGTWAPRPCAPLAHRSRLEGQAPQPWHGHPARVSGVRTNPQRATLSSLLFSALLLLLLLTTTTSLAEVTLPPNSGPRTKYGAEKLAAAANSAKVQITIDPSLPPESFRITPADSALTITAADDSGAMYACLELARLAKSNQPPTKLEEKPSMRLRGVCIGMQKTNILPGRRVYEYPYRPDLFPFFYDKSHWTEYLDFLAANRFNTLYLWNGHPFASLVRLPDYPYAVEVDDATFAKNQEMFRWIAAEADRRGIWVVQMFYSIIVSKPFAERHGIETQMEKAPPVVDDYFRKSVAAFIKEYPHVGLMVCLGEACLDLDEQTRWFTQVVLPGVKDGMQAANLAKEPPVVVRTHATDLRVVMPEALKVYKNLYTEAKFNGESLTSYDVRGKWRDIHRDMSALGSTHLMNVHILANLEPFRYGATEFIRKSVIEGRDDLGAGGLHLYPLCYWNWPDSPDVARIKQWDRDWIWFEAWGRYAWSTDRDATADRAHWLARLKEKFGADDATAGKILDAYNAAGECAPRLIRRFGITEGNRQTLSLGMLLEQLTDPKKYGENPDLWESDAPAGERLSVFVDRESNVEPHTGETPITVIDDVERYSASAIHAIDAAGPGVKNNREEFDRLANDVKCIRAMSLCYAAKARAAIAVLRQRATRDPGYLVTAEFELAKSLEHFRELARLTESTYRFANSMQTRQRKIPVPGGSDPDPTTGARRPVAYHWRDLLPIYEKELADFRQHAKELRKQGATQ